MDGMNRQMDEMSEWVNKFCSIWTNENQTKQTEINKGENTLLPVKVRFHIRFSLEMWAALLDTAQHTLLRASSRRLKLVCRCGKYACYFTQQVCKWDLLIKQ